MPGCISVTGLSELNMTSSVFDRRQLLARVGGGAGLLALAALLADEGLLVGSADAADISTGGSAADLRLNPLAPRKSHFPTKAKNIIWLFMNGGPSHVDTWQH